MTETQVITITVSNDELDSLEVYLTAEFESPEESEACKEMCLDLWRKLVTAFDAK